MHSTTDVIKFIVILTSVVALLLTILRESTKDIAAQNEAVFNKKAILKSLGENLPKDTKEMSDEEVINIFNERVKQIVVDMEGNEVDIQAVEDAGHKGGLAEHIDMKKEMKKDEKDRILPLFVYEHGGKKFYIVSIRGKGLWDAIWGNVAINSNLKTVAGASFDHQAETPGLGAEIKDNPAFAKAFEGKSLYNQNGDYTSVVVRKGGARDQFYEVDAIAGATVTCVGVSDMLKDGIQYYDAYFNKIKG